MALQRQPRPHSWAVVPLPAFAFAGREGTSSAGIQTHLDLTPPPWPQWCERYPWRQLAPLGHPGRDARPWQESSLSTPTNGLPGDDEAHLDHPCWPTIPRPARHQPCPSRLPVTCRLAPNRPMPRRHPPAQPWSHCATAPSRRCPRQTWKRIVAASPSSANPSSLARCRALRAGHLRQSERTESRSVKTGDACVRTTFHRSRTAQSTHSTMVPHPRWRKEVRMSCWLQAPSWSLSYCIQPKPSPSLLANWRRHTRISGRGLVAYPIRRCSTKGDWAERLGVGGS